MKKVISLLLALLIIFNLTPTSLANSIEQNSDNYLVVEKNENYSDAAQQLEQ